METVDIEEHDGEDVRGARRRALTPALDADGVALNHYRVPPGEGLPAGLHAHADQEEVFVVLDGTARFRTLDGPVAVDAGEAVRFGPGEFQSGENAGETTLVVLALGAPRDSEDVRVPVDCPDCGHDDLRLDTEGGLAFVCPDCDARRVPSDCPDCGSAALEVRPGDERRSVAACTDCGATFDRPPVEDGW